MKTEIEQQEDYLTRVKTVAPQIDTILKGADLNLGAQFDGKLWPKALTPVPIYVDIKNYADDDATPATSPDPEQPVESPIQREDLESSEDTPDETVF